MGPHKRKQHYCALSLSLQGLRGFVVGWRSCLLEDCAYSALQFLCYEQVRACSPAARSWPRAVCHAFFCRLCCQYKHAFQAVFGRDMGAGDTIVAGAVAGATASLVTNPLAVVTTRLTTQVCKQKRGKVWRGKAWRGKAWRGL